MSAASLITALILTRRARRQQHGPYPCPRCQSTRMRGHADDRPQGLTCLDCGWVRYTDPITRQLHDAPPRKQPALRPHPTP